MITGGSVIVLEHAQLSDVQRVRRKAECGRTRHSRPLRGGRTMSDTCRSRNSPRGFAPPKLSIAPAEGLNVARRVFFALDSSAALVIHQEIDTVASSWILATRAVGRFFFHARRSASSHVGFGTGA